MSILIKGMEMPDYCDDCPLFDDNFQSPYWCLALNKHMDVEIYEKHPDCPLIEIPDGHGRLIDADALLDKQVADAKIFEGSTFYGDKVRYDEAANAVANIINAPTVIPSDKEEAPIFHVGYDSDQMGREK